MSYRVIFSNDEVTAILVKEALKRYNPDVVGTIKVTSKIDWKIAPGDASITVEIETVEGKAIP